MAVIVDTGTRLVVQGLTGSEGRFHGLRNRAYGTKVVAGVTPGKGGQEVEDIPVFDTVAGAVDAKGANTAMVFVPAPFAADAIYEAVDAGIRTVICITEGIPAHEMLRIHTYIRSRGVTMLGPNCPGALSPGKANVGIIPAEIFREGSIGLVSRSGTLTYQIGHELTQMGLGNSTIVGIGGDPIVGSSFIDVLTLFRDDPQTEYVVMVGEIGGDEEEKAAAFIESELGKPAVAYIAGFTAPPGKTMGHAGAIISGSSGTAQAKKEALEARADSRRHDADRDGRARCGARAEVAVELARYDALVPFTTKDGSTIREYLHTSMQSLAEATLAPGQATERHYHRLSEEIYLIMAGAGRLEIDTEEREVSAGDAILIPPGAWHTLVAGADGARLLCCCVPAYSHDDTYFA